MEKTNGYSLNKRASALNSVCPACAEKNTKAWFLAHVSFRHLDFTPLGPPAEWPNVIVECCGCGVIYRILNHMQKKQLAMLYSSNDYAEHKECHMVPNNGKMYEACEVQAEIIMSNWSHVTSPKSILDIGCFDGKLLFALFTKSQAERLVGYDVAIRPEFPSNKKFEFHCKDLGAIDGKFCLITLSQSMIYIENLVQLFIDIGEKLKEYGRVFVHVPNTCLRPSSLLLGDQTYYFTPQSLKYLFARNGYEVEFVGENKFKRDIILYAKYNSNIKIKQKNSGDINTILRQLETLSKRINKITGNHLAVLGTTIDAAFTHSLISEKVSVFVDENPNKLGGIFNCKPVVAIDSLPAGSTCIIPMGIASPELLNRLTASNYQINFVTA